MFFTVVTPIVLITWIKLKLNCIYDMHAKVVSVIDFKLILRLMQQLNLVWENSQLELSCLFKPKIRYSH